MTALNIASAQAYYGETNVRSSLTTSLTTALANPAESGQLYRVNEIVVTNIDGTNSADVTVEISKGGVVYSIVTTVPVPADTALPVIAKEISLYLEEGDAIVALASANGDLEISISYEIYSSSWDRVTTRGLALYVEAADRNSYDSRENYVSYSNYNTATWSLIPVTGTGSLTTGIDDPFNGSRAVRLTANNNGNIVFRVTFPNFTPNGTDQYTISFYVRAVSGTGGVSSDLADDVGFGYGPSLVTNQWVRITYTGTPTATIKSFLDLYSDANTNRVLDFYGAQIERRSSATSLTETNGSAITTASTTWKDLTANANNGTLTNSPSFNTDGSLRFTAASSQYVTFTDSASLTASTMSIEAWVKFTTLGTRIIYCGKGQGGSFADTEYWLEKTAANQFSIWFSNGTTGSNHLLSSSSVFANVWYHVVATFDGSTMRGYVNGVQDAATFSLSGSIVNTAFAYSIGRLGTLASLYHDGYIAVNRIYQSALSAGEILQNFSAEKERFTNLLLYLDASNTASYPGSGTTWTNLSNIGINGTLTNGPTFDSANGGSIVFDGVNDYVTTGNQFDPLAGGLFAGSDSDWSVTVWFKPDITKVTDSAIVSKSGGVGGFATFVVWFNGTTLYTRLRGEILTLSSSLSNSWYNVVITWDSRKLVAKAYLNGSYVNDIQEGVQAKQTNNFTIGAAADGTNTFFKGNIAEVRIYDRTLSLSSVQSIFNSTKTKFGL